MIQSYFCQLLKLNNQNCMWLFLEKVYQYRLKKYVEILTLKMVESLMGTFNSRSMCNFQQRQKYGRQTLQDSRCPGHFVNRTSDNRFRFLLGIMVTFIRSSTRTSTGCWGLRHGFIVIKGSFFKKHLMYGHCSLIIGAW